MPDDTSDFHAAIASLEGDPRSITAELMRAALDTGIRKELRATVQLALEQASGTAPRELTDIQCRNLKVGNRISDPLYAGLMLVASKRGKRWVYRTQADGTQRQVTLGAYPSMTLAEAREKWAIVRAEGIAPRSTDKRAERRLCALADEFIEHQRATEVRSWKVTRSVLMKHLPDIAVGEVTGDALDALFMHLIDSKPGAARNIRAPISSLFNWAERTKKLPDGMNAPKLVPIASANRKEFRPRSAHMRSIMQSIDGNRWGDLIRFQMLTGVRINEALCADWSEIDGDRWIIPASRMKAKREHVVMLSRQALEILDRQPPTPGAIFDVPSMPSFFRDWAKLRDGLDLPVEYTSHTHRAALLSWIAENGGGRDIRDRISAHKPPASSDDNYQLSQLNGPAAEWWQRWANHLDAVASENVVELRA